MKVFSEEAPSKVFIFVFLVKSCGSTIYQNNSYIESPSYPDPSPNGVCSYFIEKSQTDICQYKLTFEDVVLADPFLGDCLNDTMRITGLDGVSAATVPSSLCGDLTSHESNDPPTLNLNLDFLLISLPDC